MVTQKTPSPVSVPINNQSKAVLLTRTMSGAPMVVVDTLGFTDAWVLRDIAADLLAGAKYIEDTVFNDLTEDGDWEL